MLELIKKWFELKFHVHDWETVEEKLKKDSLSRMGCGSSTRNLGFLGDRALLSFSTN